MKKDLKEAIKYHEFACDLKYGKGCFNLANFYELGTGVKQDDAKAKYYYGLDCDTGSKFSCEKYQKLSK